MTGAVPKYLCLTFLASACRYSALGYHHARDIEMGSSYAAEAWNQIVLPGHSDIGSEAALPLVQAILILSVIEYTGT